MSRSTHAAAAAALLVVAAARLAAAACPTGQVECGPRCCLVGQQCRAGLCCPGGTNWRNCFGTCRDVLTDPLACGGCYTKCAAGQECKSGLCCPPGSRNCGNVCKAVLTDRLNCGWCGRICPAIQPFCVNGQCAICPLPGQTKCFAGTAAEICVDILTSAKHCGRCGLECPASFVYKATIIVPPLSGRRRLHAAASDRHLAAGGGGRGLLAVSCPAPYKPVQNCTNPIDSSQPCTLDRPWMCGQDISYTVDLPTGLACQGGVCKCKPGLVECGFPRICRDLKTDAANCGSCFASCFEAGKIQACWQGRCMCPPGLVTCPNDPTRCTSLLFDSNNCGRCGNICHRGQVCNQGVCGCSLGLTNCNLAGTSGVDWCRDLAVDPEHCGSCTHSCAEIVAQPYSCWKGVCQCSPGTTLCDQGSRRPVCALLANDTENCGSCGTRCLGTGMTCLAGQCQCKQGYTACGNNLCADLQTDFYHCGSCANSCLNMQGAVKCQFGQCVPGSQVLCGGGLTDCRSVHLTPPGPGDCRDLETDLNSCGMW